MTIRPGAYEMHPVTVRGAVHCVLGHIYSEAQLVELEIEHGASESEARYTARRAMESFERGRAYGWFKSVLDSGEPGFVSVAEMVEISYETYQFLDEIIRAGSEPIGTVLGVAPRKEQQDDRSEDGEASPTR